MKIANYPQIYVDWLKNVILTWRTWNFIFLVNFHDKSTWERILLAQIWLYIVKYQSRKSIFEFWLLFQKRPIGTSNRSKRKFWKTKWENRRRWTRTRKECRAGVKRNSKRDRQRWRKNIWTDRTAVKVSTF